MKLLDLECPGCGARLIVDDDRQEARCEYCDTKLRLEKLANQAPSSDDAAVDRSADESSQSEKGGQRRGKHAKDPDALQPKKRHTFLWFLGWVFIFPVPLTILIMRRRNMNLILRIAFVVLAWWAYSNVLYPPDEVATVSLSSSDIGTELPLGISLDSEDVVSEEDEEKYDRLLVVEEGKVMYKVHMASTNFHIEGHYQGTSNFIVKLLDSNQELYELIANEIDSYILDKDVFVVPGNWYYLVIEIKEGDWELEWTGTYGLQK